MIKTSEILTTEQIMKLSETEVDSLLNTYQKELNRRMKILQKYAISDPKEYLRGANAIMKASGQQGFITSNPASFKGAMNIANGGKITGGKSSSSGIPKAPRISFARSQLVNIANTLRSDLTTIGGLRKMSRKDASKMKSALNALDRMSRNQLAGKGVRNLAYNNVYSISDLINLEGDNYIRSLRQYKDFAEVVDELKNIGFDSSSARSFYIEHFRVLKYMNKERMQKMIADAQSRKPELSSIINGESNTTKFGDNDIYQDFSDYLYDTQNGAAAFLRSLI